MADPEEAGEKVVQIKGIINLIEHELDEMQVAELEAKEKHLLHLEKPENLEAWNVERQRKKFLIDQKRRGLQCIRKLEEASSPKDTENAKYKWTTEKVPDF